MHDTYTHTQTFTHIEYSIHIYTRLYKEKMLKWKERESKNETFPIIGEKV